MDYNNSMIRKILWYAQSWHDYVCLFGVGKNGRGIIYDFVTNILKIKIDCYCDNYQFGISINGLPVYSFQELNYRKKNVLYIVSVSDNSNDEIIKQLEKAGCNDYIIINNEKISCFAQYLDKYGSNEDRVRYKRVLDDKEYVCYLYKNYYGKSCNIDAPKKFSEKLQWLKLYDRNVLYSSMIDKYEVKKIVANKIGESYIIPTLGIWDSFDDIDFDELPDQFVLKCTHDSGSVIICKDNKLFSIQDAKYKLEKCMSLNHYYKCREWGYKNVKPRIIAEKYMIADSKPKSPVDYLIDYKFFCFNGVPKYILTVNGGHANENETIRRIYDVNWNLLPVALGDKIVEETPEERPLLLEKMILLSQRLSHGIPHVRVDFYVISGRIYFGELTFYHWGGFCKFTPESFDETLGNCITIV